MGRVIRREDGATAVEFALIAPALFLLIFVIFQTALVFVAEQVLDNGVATVARQIRTGQLASGNAKTLVCAEISYVISCSGSSFFVDVQSSSDIGSLPTTNLVNTDGSYKSSAQNSFGTAGDYVLIRAYYEWPLVKIFGSLTLANLDNGTRLLSSYAVFRNEPASTT
ncbi:Flp pilus assembly protein TadG [Faunimonas pinastri]|uniref:Flp pilus assembly protein TadG n=1 Tax=Faunimonas pinastri TaxID=1855383 RepID=A0A1H9HIC4_9HYPH|nr:TadE/TadG family type IV pilus assembly protein [Faunimonas pinastri]SEQ62111.1 Flp pilus assembly protein TadG [Faunimonas pinastri]